MTQTFTDFILGVDDVLVIWVRLWSGLEQFTQEKRVLAESLHWLDQKGTHVEASHLGITVCNLRFTKDQKEKEKEKE